MLSHLNSGNTEKYELVSSFNVTFLFQLFPFVGRHDKSYRIDQLIWIWHLVFSQTQTLHHQATVIWPHIPNQLIWRPQHRISVFLIVFNAVKRATYLHTEQCCVVLWSGQCGRKVCCIFHRHLEEGWEANVCVPPHKAAQSDAATGWTNKPRRNQSAAVLPFHRTANAGSRPDGDLFSTQHSLARCVLLSSFIPSHSSPLFKTLAQSCAKTNRFFICAFSRPAESIRFFYGRARGTLSKKKKKAKKRKQNSNILPTTFRRLDSL